MIKYSFKLHISWSFDFIYLIKTTITMFSNMTSCSVKKRLYFVFLFRWKRFSTCFYSPYSRDLPALLLVCVFSRIGPEWRMGIGTIRTGCGTNFGWTRTGTGFSSSLLICCWKNIIRAKNMLKYFSVRITKFRCYEN